MTAGGRRPGGAEGTRSPGRQGRQGQQGRQGRQGQQGQGIVEFALLLPVFLMVLMAILEFGMAFDHAISIVYATREGARAGAALVNGGGTSGCSTGQSPNADSVDPQIVAAVQRVLTSPGSQVVLSNVTEIRIFLAGSTGAETASVNVWTYAPAAGPVVDGEPLDFTPSSTGWQACSRTNTVPAPSIGVAVRYRYQLSTPLQSLFALFGPGASTLAISDRAVMAMNPTQ